jgi:hypothetical protein
VTEGEANKLSDCGYGCNIIGGPWISNNPSCPECNKIEEIEVRRKVQVPDAQVVESLKNLKEELSTRSDSRSREIFFKINSCLFKKYPI